LPPSDVAKPHSTGRHTFGSWCVVREEWSPLLRNAGRRVVKTAICRKDMVEKGVGRICRKVGYRGEGEERMRGVR
jgi:hypothetical protein